MCSGSDMPAATMFSKFKSGTATPQNPIDSNPIVQHFEISKQTACAGPELIWKIHEGLRKNDRRVSIFHIPLHYYNVFLQGFLFLALLLLFHIHYTVHTEWEMTANSEIFKRGVLTIPTAMFA